MAIKLKRHGKQSTEVFADACSYDRFEIAETRLDAGVEPDELPDCSTPRLVG